MENLIDQCRTVALLLCLGTSISLYSQTEIDSEDFESGSFPFLMWNSGGVDCLVNSGSILTGVYSANLQDDTSSSVMYTNNIDISTYDSVIIEFDFETSSFDSGEDFFIEFSDDGGSTWSSTPVLQYVYSTDFSNSTTYTDITVTAESSVYNFTSTSRFRFRSDSSWDGDDLYLDNIVVSYTEAVDSDGDGILDSVDIDDDNDGIIDAYECENLLVDSGFDNKTGLSNGNNIGVDISPWILGGGDQANIVKVDGAGGYDYGNGGPFEDANLLTGAGEDQFYLDIAHGSNDFYQSFVVAYTAKLNYGGYFSSRDGLTGTARLRIYTGSSGSSGTLIADSGTFSVSPVGGDSSNTPWQLFEDIVSISAGTYSFVVSMDNHMNFDEGYTAACMDRDGDSVFDYIDIDSDDDGIPDNVEAQPTIGYIAPSNVSSSITDVNNNGLDDVYESAQGGTDLYNLEDTDRDGIKDYLDTDTDNDGTLDIEENGHADSLTNADTDSDGLDDNLDSITAHLDINDEVTTGDVADLTTSFGDIDNDATLGGDLDYRDLYDINPPEIASIDFDGVDDYLSRDSFIEGEDHVSIMAWVKSDSGNSTDMVIVGEDAGCKLWLQSGNTPTFTITSDGNSAVSISCGAINYDEWHHIAGVYTSGTGVLSIYVDGEFCSSDNVGGSGDVIENTLDSNGNFEIGRLSSDVSNKNYFKGDIDEVRVFDVALSGEQIQHMVYQEIENNSGSGNVKGTIVAKDIEDLDSNENVSWSNLIAYYPMTNIKTGTTSDYSGYDKELYIYNISTIQDQTAPMPYLASNDGAWTSSSTWSYGDVWDITDTSKNKSWSIVKVSSALTACHDIETLGLVIDSGSKLELHTDQLLKNNWYLELNGTIDLLGDAQLIQTETSDLVSSSTGKLLRRQEGASSAYWYNYWCSPVGVVGATALINNNDVINNSNNTPFNLNTLKDDSGMNCQFTSNYTGNGSISTYWLYAFKNGVTYWDWDKISISDDISPGEGYTQKGTGVVDSEQQYIFEGKPNNGTILIDVVDTGGTGSVNNISKTECLLGNPYASALDVGKFIDDNESVISGDILLWQQWSGTSHNLREYNGGYAQVNKLGSIRAYQFVGIEGGIDNDSQDGTIVPTKYFSVGQGFMVEIVATGTVEFNNGQRVFIKESDADNTYDNGSVFSKGTNGKKSSKAAAEKEDEEEFTKLRLEFKSLTGPDTHRELLLGFSEKTSDGFDYGFDAENKEVNNNDLYLDFGGRNMNIQAYGPITNEKVVPLNFKSSGENSFEIKISEKQNVEEGQKIYIKDNVTGAYFDMTDGDGYTFSSDQGKFNERLEIVFQSEQESLGVEELVHQENFIYYQRSERKLFGKKLDSSVKILSLVNMLGQTVLEFKNVSSDVFNNGLELPDTSSGAYVVYLRTDNNQVISKKIIVN